MSHSFLSCLIFLDARRAIPPLRWRVGREGLGMRRELVIDFPSLLCCTAAVAATETAPVAEEAAPVVEEKKEVKEKRPKSPNVLDKVKAIFSHEKKEKKGTCRLYEV